MFIFVILKPLLSATTIVKASRFFLESLHSMNFINLMSLLMLFAMMKSSSENYVVPSAFPIFSDFFIHMAAIGSAETYNRKTHTAAPIIPKAFI